MPQPAPRASSFVQPPEPWAAGGGGVSDRRAGCEGALGEDGLKNCVQIAGFGGHGAAGELLQGSTKAER
jgi:hypothetical protein